MTQDKEKRLTDESSAIDMEAIDILDGGYFNLEDKNEWEVDSDWLCALELLEEMGYVDNIE